MKKTLWIAVVGALAASVIAASAQEVLSGNAVGYVKVDISNTFTMINMPFDDMSGGPTMFTNTIGPQVMGVGALVYRYSGVDWTSYPFDRGNWNNAASLALEPGVAYFLKRPNSWTGTSNITLTGEVPEATNSQRAVTGAGNFTTVSFAYPAEVKFTNTLLAAQGGGVGASIFAYNGTDWTSYPYDRGNWNNAASLVLKPGVGYFFKAATASGGFIWNQRRPYTWPGTPLPASNGPF